MNSLPDEYKQSDGGMTGAKFKVAICGGGVGGLTFGVALSKYPDIDVEIFESCKQFTEIGAGVGVWPRGFKVFQKMGASIEQALIDAATDYEYTEDYVPTFRYRKSDQPEGVEIFRLMTKGDSGGTSLWTVVGDLMRFHRADFHRILLSHLSPSCRTHVSKRLVSYTQPASPENSPIHLTFTDGSTSTCDVLVGADGIKSAVRSCMMYEMAQTLHGPEADFALSCADPIWSGVITYRTLINAEDLRGRMPDHRLLRGPTVYLRKDAFILAYPISQGKYINFVGFTLSEDHARTCYLPDTSARSKFDGPWVQELTKEEFCKPFKGLEKETEPILECIEKGTLWAVHVVKYLPAQYHGRVALIGDAAHGMTPMQGTGAGQSVEDAYLLALVLGHPSTTLETVPRALAVYDELRRPYAHQVALKAMLTGQMSAGQAGNIPLEQFGDRMTKNWEWTWLTDLDGDLQKATEMLSST